MFTSVIFNQFGSLQINVVIMFSNTSRKNIMFIKGILLKIDSNFDLICYVREF